MATLYSGCNNLSPDFFPELLLYSVSDSKDWPNNDSDCKDNSIHCVQCYNYWLEKMIFLGKATVGTGLFGLFVVYLSIPKPYLSSQFATFSIRSPNVPAQLHSEVEKQKQGSRLEDMRSVSDPANFNTSQSQSSRRRCSPCSESVFSCFNSLKQTPTLALSSPPSVVPAQRMPSLRSATPNQVSTPNFSSQWNDRSTDDLVGEYFNKPTQKERDDFYWECEAKINGSKMTRFHDSIDRQEKYQQERANSIALAKAAEIDRHINNSNSHLLKDTIPAEGFPATANPDFQAENCEDSVPWQLRLVPKDATKIKPTDIDSYDKMKAYSGDITMDQVASQRKKLEGCLKISRKAQEIGRKRLLEVAIENGHIRTFPVLLDGHHDEQNVNNIAIILKHEPHCKFSSYKEVALLVEQAYKREGWPLPNLENTFLSSSLPPNLFSIGQNNVTKETVNPPDITWVGTTSGERRGKVWPLKVIKKSIKYKGVKLTDMILVNQDMSHLDEHYETYNVKGIYLGTMDKDTMLLYAEAIPYGDRFAVPKKNVK